jgi:signal transduction histidine kinase
VRTAFGQLTIRTRLALLNATVFVVGNAALLTLIWVSVGEIIGRNSSTVTAVATRSEDGGCQPTAPSVPASGVAATVPGRFAVFEEDVMGELWKRCLLLLIMMGFLSLLASWWVARRGLARIARVTAAARGIEDRNLHARLSLAGPDDEAKELADTFDAMLDRLERSFTEQRRFTGHASHELRTPLTVQRTALEIPLVQGRVPPRAGRHPAQRAPDRRAAGLGEGGERCTSSRSDRPGRRGTDGDRRCARRGAGG